MHFRTSGKSTHILLILAWFVYSNHCILNNALAQSAASAQEHRHCHGSDDSGKNDSGENGHSSNAASGSKSEKSGHSSEQDKGCCNNGCCSPALNALDAYSIMVSASDNWNPFVPNPFIELQIEILTLDLNVIISGQTGPPIDNTIPNLYYSLAANAPPVLS